MCSPCFSFIGGVAKKKITKHGCEKYFCRGHILSTIGDALTKEHRSTLNGELSGTDSLPNKSHGIKAHFRLGGSGVQVPKNQFGLI
jgi:hypothetical protein